MGKKQEKKNTVKGKGYLALLAIGFAVYAYGSNTAGTTHNATCKSLERLWEHNGGSSSTALMAAKIAMAESGGKSGATDKDKNGSVDRGFWQINSVHGALSTYDPNGNAKAAVRLSDNGKNWYPWTTYRSGAYSGEC